MDLSRFSTPDLIAIKGGDLSQVSTAGLHELKNQQNATAANESQANLARNGASGAQLMQGGIDPTEGGLPFRPFGIDTGLTMPEGISNFMAGTGKAVKDSAHGIYQLGADAAEAIRPTSKNLSSLITGKQPESLSARLRRETDDTKRLDEPLMNTGGGVTGNVLGNIGLALAPGAALKGAGVVANTAKANDLAQALRVAGGAAMVPKTILGAGAQGAAFGAIQPVGVNDSRTTNTAVGGAMGAVVPTVAAVAKGAKSLIDPLTESGQAKILGRALMEASGGDANLLSKLNNAKELVPGSLPTVGEAADNPSIAALQRSAFATTPEVMNEVVTRNAANNTARAQAVERIAGAPGERAQMEGVRDMMSKPLYDAASKSKVPLTISDRKISEIMSRPSMEGAWAEAEKMAREAGITSVTSKGEMTGETLHYLKMALDEKIANAKPGSPGERLLVGTKKDLMKWMEKVMPEYAQANANFASWSKPVNAMDVGQAFADKSSALTGALRPEQFAAALRNGDNIASAATGFRGATLENSLAPHQISALNAVKDDLARSQFAQNAGRTGSDTVQKLAYNNMLSRTGVPTLLRNFGPGQIVGNIAAQGANMVYSNANKTLQRKLAEAMLDPRAAADLIQKATPSQRSALVAALTRNTLQPLAASTPALLNANQ